MRRTADQVLSQLLERVDQVNERSLLPREVTKVVDWEAIFKPMFDRLSDVDVAVELQPKEADWGRMREAKQECVQQLRTIGHRFRNWLEVECWWHLEAFRLPKGRSGAISLIDL